MEDKHKNYLDKVVEFLVRDTKIDFKGNNIFFPSTLFFSSLFSLPPLLHPSFSKYSKEVYGLTDQEMEYVWKEYKSIIKDKIKNGR